MLRQPWGLGVVLEHVHERYCARWTLDGVCLTVAPGEVVALVGPPSNGAGALLGLIAARRAPQAGAIRIVGRPALQALDGEGFFARSLSRLPSSAALLDSLSVEANLEGPLMARRNWPERRQHVATTLERFELRRLARTPVGRLDASQRARVKLAMALIARPRLLLIDGPRERVGPGSLADALRAYARLRGGEGDPTVIVAPGAREKAIEAQRTIELPYALAVRAAARSKRTRVPAAGVRVARTARADPVTAS